jgi:hypothetical protein
MKTIIVILLLAGMVSVHAESRIWTGVDGSVVEAKLTTVLGNKVVLTKVDRTVITVPLHKLCAVDIAYVEDHLTSKKNADTTNVDAIVECEGAKFFRLRKGYAVYSNHPQEFHSVPDKFVSRKIMLLENYPTADNKDLVFVVTKPGVVTIILEKGLLPKLEKDGWKKVDVAFLDPNRPRELPIMQKYLEKGCHTIPNMKLFGTRLILP